MGRKVQIIKSKSQKLSKPKQHLLPITAQSKEIAVKLVQADGIAKRILDSSPKPKPAAWEQVAIGGGSGEVRIQRNGEWISLETGTIHIQQFEFECVACYAELQPGKAGRQCKTCREK